MGIRQIRIDYVGYGVSMITALTHNTALRYLRNVAVASPTRTMREEGKNAAMQLSMQREFPGVEEAEWLALAFPELSTPYQVLVSDQAKKRPGNNMEYRGYCTNFPEGALVSLGPNIAVASPELTFVQYASCVDDFIQVVLFGYELCGTYRFSEEDRTIKHGFPPLSSHEKLADFLSVCSGIHGLPNARKAVKYVRDNSGSYMETALALLWGLPGMYGGCSLPFPDMNYRVDCPGRKPDSSGRTFYLCDLCWPEKKVCVEYDSDSHHGSTEQMAKDSEKRIALTEMGYTVLEMTRQQVMNEDSFERFTNVLMDALGEHPRIRAADYEAKRRQLWWRLLKSYSTYC